jgi:hypothetical protein
VVEKLLETKEFLTHSDVTLNDDRENSCYVVFGYPTEWSVIPTENSLLSIPLVFVTRRYKGELHPDAFYDPRVHIVLELNQSAISVADGSLQRLPSLRGVSGCGIWRVCEWSRKGFEHWRPEQVSLVAIQHRFFRKRKYIQGTWVAYVLALIKEKYPDVSAAMNIVYPQG